MQTVTLIYLPRGRQTSSAFEPHGLVDRVVIVVGPPVLSSGDMVGSAGLVRSSVDVSTAVVVVVAVVVLVVVDVVVVVVVVVDDDATVVVVDVEDVIGTPVAPVAVAVVNIRAGKQQSSVESKLGKLVLSQPRGYSEGQ